MRVQRGYRSPRNYRRSPRYQSPRNRSPKANHVRQQNSPIISKMIDKKQETVSICQYLPRHNQIDRAYSMVWHSKLIFAFHLPRLVSFLHCEKKKTGLLIHLVSRGPRRAMPLFPFFF